MKRVGIATVVAVVVAVGSDGIVEGGIAVLRPTHVRMGSMAPPRTRYYRQQHQRYQWQYQDSLAVAAVDLATADVDGEEELQS